MFSRLFRTPSKYSKQQYKSKHSVVEKLKTVTVQSIYDYLDILMMNDDLCVQVRNGRQVAVHPAER